MESPGVGPTTYPAYMKWLDEGRAAGMDYLSKLAGARANPSNVLEGARTVVMLSTVYGRRDTAPTDPAQGKVARYARGLDYHKTLWKKLDALLAWVKLESPGTTGRGVCDTAPLLERDFARLAGLGWIGKNTMLIDRKLGSFTVLAALLLDLDLEPDRRARPTIAEPARDASTLARPTPLSIRMFWMRRSASVTGRSSTEE